jgi:hypothetical protein
MPRLPKTAVKSNQRAARDGAAPLLNLHEACAVWPPMSSEALAELVADIEANGLVEPITHTPDGQILDGRNRAMACALAGVTPTFIVYPGDPWLYSISKNARRRHMTVDQVAMRVAQLATRGEGGDGSNQHGKATGSTEPVASSLSVAQVAAAANVPETAIKSAKVVLAHGTAEEIEAVKTDKAPLRRTADVVRARKLAGAPRKKPPTPSRDPIDDVAKVLVDKCADAKWRSIGKLASVTQYAASAIQEAIGRLGQGRVDVRTGPTGPEYLIGQDEDRHWPSLLAARDAEIADLKQQLREKDAEIAQLKAELISAPSLALQ